MDSRTFVSQYLQLGTADEAALGARNLFDQFHRHVLGVDPDPDDVALEQFWVAVVWTGIHASFKVNATLQTQQNFVTSHSPPASIATAFGKSTKHPQGRRVHSILAVQRSWGLAFVHTLVTRHRIALPLDPPAGVLEQLQKASKSQPNLHAFATSFRTFLGRRRQTARYANALIVRQSEEDIEVTRTDLIEYIDASSRVGWEEPLYKEPPRKKPRLGQPRQALGSPSRSPSLSDQSSVERPRGGIDQLNVPSTPQTDGGRVEAYNDLPPSPISPSLRGDFGAAFGPEDDGYTTFNLCTHDTPPRHTGLGSQNQAIVPRPVEPRDERSNEIASRPHDGQMASTVSANASRKAANTTKPRSIAVTKHSVKIAMDCDDLRTLARRRGRVQSELKNAKDLQESRIAQLESIVKEAAEKSGVPAPQQVDGMEEHAIEADVTKWFAEAIETCKEQLVLCAVDDARNHLHDTLRASNIDPTDPRYSLMCTFASDVLMPDENSTEVLKGRLAKLSSYEADINRAVQRVAEANTEYTKAEETHNTEVSRYETWRSVASLDYKDLEGFLS
ncbi:hypothetical protein FB567DRAFT_260311 [Paraphoma chrysanthemicola]|uniref:Uncharacterized protein n=1 Tax=Paraphoma chrysanthemicola TaxID=798071 RepID=A0A8K0QRA6_9PLEO|nr:hypothetical protein FB567DRAFT_260311 [Paraphoma chrysanthemicola]